MPTAKKKKPFRFWYHYNKPEAQKQRCCVMTLHYGGTCHLIHSISCKVNTESKERLQQPRCVIQGWASHIETKASKDETGTTKILAIIS
tara:strand:+ start:872 stop:1138 length:267 start_codon:yes stop_codon:yes gene_type:complete